MTNIRMICDTCNDVTEVKEILFLTTGIIELKCDKCEKAVRFTKKE